MASAPAPAPADGVPATPSTENLPNQPETQSSASVPAVNSDSPATESSQLPAPRPQESLSSGPITVTIPSYSRWFSWMNIHETERRLLSEFFDSKSASKSPNVYKYYRDSIVNKYRENPSRKISFTEVRRTIVGDVGAIRRVFDFLEAWGLINYTASRQNLKWEDRESKSAAATSNPENSGDSPAVKKEGARRVCDGCKSMISIACFACDKVDMILCARCFVRGNYRVGLNSADFKRVDINEVPTRTDWTDKETLHLLEAVLHYGDDWKKVAEHVGSRSEKECVNRFIKFPFGEQFMGPVEADEIEKYYDLIIDESNGETGVMKSSLSSPSKKRRLTPLADASNPLMAQSAFLSALVGSEVAEAAAQAAIAALPGKYLTDLKKEKGEKTTNLAEVTDKQEAAAANGCSTARNPGEAATEAHALLEKEEKDLEQSISNIIDVEMREIQRKIVEFERLELQLEKEWAQLINMKNLLFSDQLTLLQQRAPLRFPESAER